MIELVKHTETMQKSKSADPIIIGLTGSIGSGCSEAAKYLKDNFGYRIYKLSDIIRDHISSNAKSYRESGKISDPSKPTRA